MPSRAESDYRRVLGERIARSLAIALAAWAFWSMLTARATGGVERLTGAALERSMPALVASPPTSLRLEFADQPPTPPLRDALAALARTGTRLSWGANAMAPLAMSVERVREPGAPVRIAVASSGTVALRDDLAPLDTVNAAPNGATLVTAAPSGMITATAGGVSASVAAPTAGTQHALLVLGHASWESKFVVAALEEQGWAVDARIGIAPGADVKQGAITTLDTAHYAAVIALDSALGGIGPQLQRFVRSGGGLILSGEAAAASAVSGFAPASVGARTPSAKRSFDAAEPLASLGVVPLVRPRADIVRLASRGPILAIAARSEGTGRVIQLGYDETWRWRMEGGDDAVAAHRAWWSRLVASVVPAPLAALTPPPALTPSAAPAATPAGQSSGEGTPLARLRDALGEPTAESAGLALPRGLPNWILPLIFILLLGEWASRRLRGAR